MRKCLTADTVTKSLKAINESGTALYYAPLDLKVKGRFLNEVCGKPQSEALPSATRCLVLRFARIQMKHARHRVGERIKVG